MYLFGKFHHFHYGELIVCMIYFTCKVSLVLNCCRCFASVFVVENALSGFYTGMFISEVAEAEMFFRDGEFITTDQITSSNIAFAELVCHKVQQPLLEMCQYVRTEYGKHGLAHNNCSVVAYNCPKIGFACPDDPLPTHARHQENEGDIPGSLLIIHPSPTPTCLLEQTEQLLSSLTPPPTVLTSDLSKTDVIHQIRAHDHIWFIGEGDAEGLYGLQQFGDKEKFGNCYWIVDSSPEVLSMLREKKCVYCW